MSMFTPGPWTSEGLVILGAAGENVATVVDDLDPDDDGLAKYDAKLIAAAPELLEALQMMLDKFENDVRHGESGWDAVEAARTAVAKATNLYPDYRPE